MVVGSVALIAHIRCDNKAKKFLQYLSVPSYMLKTDRSSEYKKSLNDSNDYIKQIQYIIEQTLHYYSTTYGHLTKQKYNYDDFVHIILYLTEKTFTEYEIKDEIDAERLLKYMNLYHFENGWFDYNNYDRFKNDFLEFTIFLFFFVSSSGSNVSS